MLLGILLACAPMYRMPGPLTDLGRDIPVESRAPTQGGAAIAKAATGFLGVAKLEVRGVSYRGDCSGLVEASLARAGWSYAGSSADLWQLAQDRGVAHRRKRPAPGDIAFFDNTYDRNGNGRLDDELSHSAIVETVAPDGTITMVHYSSNGIVRLRMNLDRPHDDTVNDQLRAASRKDPGATKYLAGELWVGFASFYRSPVQVADGS